MTTAEARYSWFQVLVGIAAGAAALTGIYSTHWYSYLLFHSLAEMFSIVVAFGVFIVFWNSRRFLDNGCFLLIGVAYLFVGLIDLLHALAFKGMGVFPSGDGNLATQLWVGARYVEAVSMLAAPLLLRRRLRPPAVLAAYAMVVSLLLAWIFSGAFPVCYRDGQLTAFKKVSEAVVCLALAGSLGLFYVRRRELDATVLRCLSAALVTAIGSEIAFTFYGRVDGLANMVGHLLKLVAFFLIYKALIEAGLTRPYALLFRNLKQSEEALRESETRFRQIAETIDDVFWLTDAASGQILFTSPAYEQVWGRPVSDLYDNPHAWIDAIHPDDRARVDAAYAELAMTDTYDEEYRVVRPDGSIRWVRDRGFLVRDADGRATRITGVAEDITERREAENAARAAQQELLEHQRLEREEVEKELAKAKDQLVRQTRLATIGQVSASIAHDLRNPLAVVRNAAYLLKRKLPPDQPKWLYYLETIDREVDTANQIITNLMEAVRAKDPTKRPVDLEKMVCEVFERARRDGQFRLESQFDPLPFVVQADPVQLRQVLSNLFANAVQAMGREGKLRVEARRIEGFDILRIEDTGPGIPENIRDQIFDPLVSSRPKGTGLGLAICRQLIQRHGGAIDLVRTDSAGTTFEIRLPG